MVCVTSCLAPSTSHVLPYSSRSWFSLPRSAAPTPFLQESFARVSYERPPRDAIFDLPSTHAPDDRHRIPKLFKETPRYAGSFRLRGRAREAVARLRKEICEGEWRRRRQQPGRGEWRRQADNHAG